MTCSGEATTWRRARLRVLAGRESGCGDAQEEGRLASHPGRGRRAAAEEGSPWGSRRAGADGENENERSGSAEQDPEGAHRRLHTSGSEPEERAGRFPYR